MAWSYRRAVLVAAAVVLAAVAIAPAGPPAAPAGRLVSGMFRGGQLGVYGPDPAAARITFTPGGQPL
jgi:hypothetical protein